MKGNKVKIIAFIVIVAILVLWGIRVGYLVRKYPSAKVVDVSIEDELVYKDIGYKVKNVRILSSKDIKELIEEYNLDESNYEEKGILVDLDVINYSDETFTVSPANYLIGFNVFGGSMNLYDYFLLNEEFTNSSSKIVPGDTANVKMLFRYSEVLLGNKFSKFEDMDWGLIFSFYPIKYRIKLV